MEGLELVRLESESKCVNWQGLDSSVFRRLDE
jgi:hypothetical protein